MGLVIKRKPGECIEIGEVTIRIGEISGKCVSVIIDGPKSVAINRPTKEKDLIDRVSHEELRRKLGQQR